MKLMKPLKIKKYVFISSIFCLSLILSSCSVLGPIQKPAPSNYLVDSLPEVTQLSRRSQANILILVPEIRPAFNTNRMAYSKKQYSIDYFSQNQWIETPQEMLLPLIAQSLNNTHYFKAVLMAPNSGHYKYMMHIYLQNFIQDFTVKPASFRIVARLELWNALNNHLIATKQFSIASPIKRTTPYGGVKAANLATQELLSAITDFTLHQLK